MYLDSTSIQTQKQLSRLVLFSTLAALGFGLGWLLTSSVPSRRSGIGWRLLVVMQYRPRLYNSDISEVVRHCQSFPGHQSWLWLGCRKTEQLRRRKIYFWAGWDWPLRGGLLSAAEPAYYKPTVMLPPTHSLARFQSQVSNKFTRCWPATFDPMTAVLTVTRFVQRKTLAQTILLSLLACDLLVANKWILSSPNVSMGCGRSIEQQIEFDKANTKQGYTV